MYVCRVTPKGGAAVEGSTATKAWSALFTTQDSARALGYSGAKQFGLQHPRVQRLLQSLPGAARCERYAAWQGQAPDVPCMVGFPDYQSRTLPKRLFCLLSMIWYLMKQSMHAACLMHHA